MTKKTSKSTAVAPRPARLTLTQVANVLIETEDAIRDAVLEPGFPQPDAEGLFLESEVRALLNDRPDEGDARPEGLRVPDCFPAGSVVQPIPAHNLAVEMPYVGSEFAFAARPASKLFLELTEAERCDLARVVAGAIQAGLTYRSKEGLKPVRNFYGWFSWLKDQLAGTRPAA